MRPPPPREPTDLEIRLFEDEGQSVASGPASSEETAGRASKTRVRIWKQALLDMLNASSATGASGVVLGLPGDGNNIVKKVDRPNDIVPPCFLPQQLGHRIRTGLIDPDPRFDHDGIRLEDIGLGYEEFCDSFNPSLIGTI